MALCLQLHFRLIHKKEPARDRKKAMASIRFPKKCTYSELERNLNIFFFHENKTIDAIFFSVTFEIGKMYVGHTYNNKILIKITYII